MKKISIMILFFISFSGVIFSQNISREEYNKLAMHYFETKDERIIYETIEIYKNDIQNSNFDKFDSNVMFFFYGIKKDNIDRYYSFYEIVKQSKANKLVRIFNSIEESVVDNYLLNPPISTTLNDYYWTLYFSSGNVDYLNQILVIINMHKDSDDMIKYLAANSGIWSFMLNVKTYPNVLNYIERNQIIDKELKRIILEKDVNDFNKEVVEHLKIQREKGNW